jgi:ribosome-associated protein
MRPTNPSADPAPGRVPLAPGVAAPASALVFSFVASGGPGGQNVNKVATKAELRVRLADLPLAGPVAARLAALAGRRLTEAGEIVISNDEHRSQSRNREECLARLRELIVRAQVKPKVRRKTRPSRGSVERRLESKKRRGGIKRERGGAGEE